MEELITKIKKIQNKQQSLMWGHAVRDDGEVVFAVGNKAYPKQPHFFSVTPTYTVKLLDNIRSSEKFKDCADSKDVLSSVILLLKEWFPAKGQSEA